MTAALVAALLLVGAVTKYLVPGKRLQGNGISTGGFALGALGAVVGFFTIPVVGLPIGFVAGIFVWAGRRHGRARAWPATKAALGAIGLGIVIEFSFAFTAAAVWVVGAVVAA